MEIEKLVEDKDTLIRLLTTRPVLVTTNGWFYGPDGQQYNAAWGKARIMSVKALLGADPGGNSVNWLMIFDGGDEPLIIGGCQIHYIQVCSKPPKNDRNIWMPNLYGPAKG